jgi:hypothetical protein
MIDRAVIKHTLLAESLDGLLRYSASYYMLKSRQGLLKAIGE